jgi:hypothetical protein
MLIPVKVYFSDGGKKISQPNAIDANARADGSIFGGNC